MLVQIFTTFGPVEKLKWKLWNHRKSYLEFKNRFNWISKATIC